MKLRHVVTAAAISGAFAVIVTGPGAFATHEPADKVGATASDIDRVNSSTVLLQEEMRVSSTSDLILATTAECSILTSLMTEGGDVAEEQDGAFGQVELWITIDGKRVPVSTNDENTDDEGTPNEDENTQGEVVFCNRAYQRSATDAEDGDGLDSEDDFIRTRTANGFNWMAFDVGREYDADGDNVVDIVLHGRYTRETSEDGVAGSNRCEDPGADNSLVPLGQTCADAFVGSRSLIIEAVHASNHEEASPVDDDPDAVDADPTPTAGLLP